MKRKWFPAPFGFGPLRHPALVSPESQAPTDVSADVNIVYAKITGMLRPTASHAARVGRLAKTRASGIPTYPAPTIAMFAPMRSKATEETPRLH